MTDTLGLYISVPFCRAKCTFCNFASGVFADERLQQYVDQLCVEIAAAPARAASLGAVLPDRVDTLYLGGGTPSLLQPAQVYQIFRALAASFALQPGCEFTLECAPGQLHPETLEAMQQHGLNRISFGVQSFVDRESAAIGRLHTRQICLDEITRVRAAGIANINLDLISGLPHQTEASWQSSLQVAIDSGAPHLSVYMLEVDEDSRLGQEVLAHGTRYGAAALPTDDQSAAWYQQACQQLQAAGVRQYEISNFAREGAASRHNLKYWLRHPYLGFGLDAHSMLETQTGAVRFANADALESYAPMVERSPLPMLASAALTVEVLTEDQAFEESLFLGLRLTEGVCLQQLARRFGTARLQSLQPALQELFDAGLLQQTGQRLALTAEGRMLSNEVFSRLLLAPAG
ncbi:MAG: radical SAM family heme chaperone HemW [Acidobacteriota bacterium]|nr:radical SAM family heme chaperone HemW [Acidobacteriota bacterium]